MVRRASGTAAPEESVTVPATPPYTAWADAGRVGQGRASSNPSDTKPLRCLMTSASVRSQLQTEPSTYARWLLCQQRAMILWLLDGLPPGAERVLAQER
jgi:hypothetical protein